MFDWLKPKRKDDTDHLSQTVAQVATKIVAPPTFRTAAAEAAGNLDPSAIATLSKRFHSPPDAPDGFGPKEVGLGGWLSYWQLAIFEIYYNFGADAIPALRPIAYGEYDWTQGNAIEILCRLAADGVQTREIVDELKREFPKLRYEAQLYAVRPMLAQAENNPQLAKIIDELSALEEFQETVAELTEEHVNQDPENITNENLHGLVGDIRRVNEQKWNKNIIGVITVSGLDYMFFDECGGNAQLGVSDNTRLLRSMDDELKPITLDDVSYGDRVAIGHFAGTDMTEPVTIYPESITVL